VRYHILLHDFGKLIPGLTGDGEAFIKKIFRYSGNVPLNLALKTSALMDDYWLVRRWLNLVRNFHHRLKGISIRDLILDKATSYIFPQNTDFPVLPSLTTVLLYREPSYSMLTKSMPRLEQNRAAVLELSGLYQGA
jgi:hypothetical protein